MAKHPVPESEIKLSPMDTLMRVPGVTLKQIEGLNLPPEFAQDHTAFELEIENEKKWQRWLKTPEGLNLFGNLAMQAYGDRLNPPTYNPEDKTSVETAIADVADADIGSTDRMMIIGDQTEIKSLLAYTLSEEEDGNYGYVYLDQTSAKGPNQALEGTLLDQLAKKDLAGVTGLVCLPQEMAKNLKVLNANGYDLFVAGHRNGVVGDRGDAEQQANINEIHEGILEDFEDQGSVIKKTNLPPGYVPYKKADKPIPPATAEEIATADPTIRDFFTEVIAKPQEKIGDKGTVNAIMAALKRK